MNPQQPGRLLTVDSVRGVPVARFNREVVLTGQQADAAGTELIALLAGPGPPRLALDFGNVESLSSLMLGKLVQVNRSAETRGGRFVLFNLRPAVREILEVSRLTLILLVYAGEQEAVKSF